MSLWKRSLPSVMFLVAGVVFLIAAFIPTDEPANRYLLVIGVVLLVIAIGTFRRAAAGSSDGD